MQTGIPGRGGPLLRLREWWDSHRRGGSIPKRSALNPEDLRCVLPDLFLVDARQDIDTGYRSFPCRLTGTEMDDMLGVNLTGLCVEDFPFPAEKDSIVAEFNKAVADARPVYGTHSLDTRDHRHVECDWMLVPLASEESEQVSWLLGAIEFKCSYATAPRPGHKCPGREDCDRRELWRRPGGCGLPWPTRIDRTNGTRSGD